MFYEMKFVVKGNIPSKANQYDIGVLRGKPTFRKKKSVSDYEASFLSQVWPKFDFVFGSAKDLPATRMINVPFELLVEVYYKNNGHDLDNAFKTLLDCCQQAKLISNDNLCMHIMGWKYVDKNDPRVEFTLRPYGKQEENKGK